MLYKYRNDTLQWINSLENNEPKETYSDEDLDAIEAAAAEQYKNSISITPEPAKPKTWQETFKSIDLRSDRLKKLQEVILCQRKKKNQYPLLLNHVNLCQ